MGGGGSKAKAVAATAAADEEAKTAAALAAAKASGGHAASGLPEGALAAPAKEKAQSTPAERALYKRKKVAAGLAKENGTTANAILPLIQRFEALAGALGGKVSQEQLEGMIPGAAASPLFSSLWDGVPEAGVGLRFFVKRLAIFTPEHSLENKLAQTFGMVCKRVGSDPDVGMDRHHLFTLMKEMNPNEKGEVVLAMANGLLKVRAAAEESAKAQEEAQVSAAAAPAPAPAPILSCSLLTLASAPSRSTRTATTASSATTGSARAAELRAWRSC